MAHFFKCNAKGTRFFAVVEEGAKFGFGGTGQDVAHNVAHDVDGAVGGVGIGVPGGLVGQIEITRGAGTGFDNGKVGGVAFDGQHHVAGGETDDGVRIQDAWRNS